MKKYKKDIIILIILFYLPISISINTSACKDIIACGDSTEGDYNLLLKVRDPSRPGLQVLTIINKDYEYEYHHPWTGEKINFTNSNKYIGVASKDDVIPNIVKAGMVFTDKGLAFGDADTNSNWINPTRYAWDDFDWIRYSCENANNIDDAVGLLTIDAVDKLHAPGVSENLFVVGPDNGYLIESDAYQYKIRELENEAIVMSNYPKELWNSQILNTFKISSSFNINKTENIEVGEIIKLNSFYGVKILDIKEEDIIARQVPIIKINLNWILFVGNKIEIGINERKTVGDFSIELLDIQNNVATIKISNKFKAWEDEMLHYINAQYGKINVKHMMNWSRLKSSDLRGLRGMCEGSYKDEAVSIYKIPKENYDLLSIGWFSPSQSCSSIFVPFHISDYDIFDVYETGEAAQLCQNLFEIYGYDNLTSFEEVENIFLFENEIIEKIAENQINKKDVVSNILTIFDNSVQKQAYLVENIWYELNNIVDINEKTIFTQIINDIWIEDYNNSFENMKNSILELNKYNSSSRIIEFIAEFGLCVCDSRIDIGENLNLNIEQSLEYYNLAKEYIENFEYSIGFDYLKLCFTTINNVIM